MPGYSDLFAPRFVLQSDTPGVDLSDIANDIVAMSYEDVARRMDKCTLTLANKGYKYANDPRFDGSIQFKMRFGYANEFSDEKKLLVKGAQQGFGDGMPLIQLTAYDIGAYFGQKVRPYNYGRVNTSEIVTNIAEAFGMSASVDDSNDRRPQAYVQPANVSCYEYVSKLAEKIGFDFWIERDTLYYKRMATGDAPSFVYEFFYGGGSVLTAFNPEIRTARPPATQHAGVNKHGDAGHAAQTGLHPSDERSYRALTNTRINFENGERTTHMEPIPRTEPTPETHPQVQAAHARAAQSRIEMRATRASATFVGQPRLKARSIIKVIVPELRYSGLWRVEECSHDISGSAPYVTQAKLSKSGLTTRHPNVPRNQQNQHESATGGTTGGTMQQNVFINAETGVRRPVITGTGGPNERAT